MDLSEIKHSIASSPAFIFERNPIDKTLQKLALLRKQSGCKVLYSIKSLPLQPVLEWMLPYVDGFSVSSLFEACLARDILTNGGFIHFTSPGLKVSEVAELNNICSHVSCNSWYQYDLFAELPVKKASIGLRINPKQSFLSDVRYNPCRQHSKLGVDLILLNKDMRCNTIKGLHFHTMFAAEDFRPLSRVVQVLQNTFGQRLSDFDWINLGGGYLFDRIEDYAAFTGLVHSLKTHDLDIFIEPGKAIVGQSGYLLTTVIDLFVSDGKYVAVLDTSINHLPEVFEYQIQPELCENCPDGDFSIILAGSTCLAGDLFGEYRFSKMLKIGEKLVFKQVGAYSLVKANRFNGYNLPDIYSWESGKLTLLKRYDYNDYYRQWSADKADLINKS